MHVLIEPGTTPTGFGIGESTDVDKLFVLTPCHRDIIIATLDVKSDESCWVCMTCRKDIGHRPIRIGGGPWPRSTETYYIRQSICSEAEKWVAAWTGYPSEFVKVRPVPSLA